MPESGPMREVLTALIESGSKFSGSLAYSSSMELSLIHIFSLSSCAAAGRASGMRMGMDAPYESVAAMAVSYTHLSSREMRPSPFVSYLVETSARIPLSGKVFSSMGVRCV